MFNALRVGTTRPIAVPLMSGVIRTAVGYEMPTGTIPVAKHVDSFNANMVKKMKSDFFQQMGHDTWSE